MSNKKTQVIAIIALLCIVISIIGTGLLFILGNNNNPTEQTELTPEQIAEIQKMIEEQSQIDNNTIDDNIDIQDFTTTEELENNN